MTRRWPPRPPASCASPARTFGPRRFSAPCPRPPSRYDAASRRTGRPSRIAEDYFLSLSLSLDLGGSGRFSGGGGGGGGFGGGGGSRRSGCLESGCLGSGCLAAELRSTALGSDLGSGGFPE